MAIPESVMVPIWVSIVIAPDAGTTTEYQTSPALFMNAQSGSATAVVLVAETVVPVV
jgi:hypothetical protein